MSGRKSQMSKTHYFDVVDSTNNKAKELAAHGAKHGTVVWAKQQTSGRGRLGKQWKSVKGKGLFMSIVLRPRVACEELARITLVIGLAVSEVLDTITGVEVQLKWPNDVLIEDKKCCGILVESSSVNAEEVYVVAGIGINVNHSECDFLGELEGNATSLAIVCGKDKNLEKVMELVRDSVLQKSKLFEQGEFPALLAQWRKRDCLAGKLMQCIDCRGRIVQGIALGPDENGILHVRDEEGREYEVMSGDIRLAIVDGSDERLQ
ncbi:MAG: biotin--[acetyl-CoA-carboxylase] ligase [Desulfobacterales bacterium]|nr:MAG: biotin--[acetyl-CoA-carboxylase] ligase [Desulfobacterales bacterium]